VSRTPGRFFKQFFERHFMNLYSQTKPLHALLAVVAIVAGIGLLILLSWGASCATDDAQCGESSARSESPLPSYSEELPHR
jgi:hypothetical protein